MHLSKKFTSALTLTGLSVAIALGSAAAHAQVIPDFSNAPFSDRDAKNSRSIVLDDAFFIGMSGGSNKGLFSYTDAQGWQKMPRGGRAIDDDNGSLIMRDRDNVFRLVDGQFEHVTSFERSPRAHWITAAGSGIVVAPLNDRRIKGFVAKDLNTGESVSIPDFPFGGETKFLNLRITDDKLYAKVGVWRSAYHLYSLDLAEVRRGGGEWKTVTDANEEALAFSQYRGHASDVYPVQDTAEISSDKWQDLSAGLPIANQRGAYTLVEQNGNVYVSVTKVAGAGIYALNDMSLTWEKIANHKSGYHPSRFVSAADRLYITGNLYISEFDPETGRYFDITAQLTDKKLFGLRIYGSEFGLIAKGSSKKDRKGKDWLAMYTPTDGKWRDIAIPAKGRVDKVQTDKSGNLWMNMKDNPEGGLFRAQRNADGSYQEFVMVAPQSGPSAGNVAVANDGEVYFIREKAKYTQIQAVYRYQENEDGFSWVQVHQDKGYGAPGFAMGEDAVFIASGRFNEYVIQGSKKWQLPNTSAYSGAQHRSAVIRDVALMIETEQTGKRSFIESIKAIRVDTANTVPYDANLDLYGTYLNEQETQAIGTEILASGEILVAMNDTESGLLMLLSPDGRTVVSQTRVDGRIVDIDSDTQGSQIALSHGSVVSIFSGNDDAISFNDYQQKTFEVEGHAKSVAIADNGHLAVLVGKTVNVFDTQDEALIYERPFNFSYVTDIEIDAEGENYFLTSFNNQRLPSGKPVQSARIASYNIAAGAQASSNWVRFDERGHALSNDIADTRLYRVELGADGYIYTLGESAGTKSQFRWDGTDLEGDSPLRFIDHHNDLWNTGSAHVAYHARLDANSGDIIDAQLTMGRLNSGKSNTFRVKDGDIDNHQFGDIAATQDGMHIVTGSVNAHMSNRAGGLTINGEPVSTYNGGDATVMVLGKKFRTRPTWATLDKSNDFNGFVTSVAVRGDKMVVLTDVKAGETFTSEDAIISENVAGKSVHLSIIDMKSQYKSGGLKFNF